MENWKKYGIAALFLVLVAGAYFLANSYAGTRMHAVDVFDGIGATEGLTGYVAKAGTPLLAANLGYTGMVCPKVTRANGVVEEYPCKHNIITNRGLELIELEMRGDAQVVLNKIALGLNTTPQVATDTNLDGIYTDFGLAIATGTLKDEGTGNWSITYEWTCSADGKNVNATGIYNTTSAGQLFAETTFGQITLNTNDKLNITYYTWVEPT